MRIYRLTRSHTCTPDLDQYWEMETGMMNILTHFKFFLKEKYTAENPIGERKEASQVFPKNSKPEAVKGKINKGKAKTNSKYRSAAYICIHPFARMNQCNS